MVNMNRGRATGIILALGGIVAGIGLLSSNPQHGTETWLAFASVYLLTGILLGGYQFVRENETISFGYACIVAVVSTLVPLAIRVWSVMAARPELTPSETSFVIWQFHVLVPFVIAFMAPLGIAKSGTTRGLTTVIIVAPFLVATVQGLLMDFGFGPTFAVLYHAILLLSGTIMGLPLYLYGRNQQGKSPRFFGQKLPAWKTTS